MVPKKTKKKFNSTTRWDGEGRDSKILGILVNANLVDKLL